jgi:sigma-B regulation protein RsbU (phosphoserine phosphatase)
MSEQLATTLPPDGRSAGRARRAIEAALDDAGLAGFTDEALLLVTELVTNAVVHAGTDMDLRIDTAPGWLRVEVMDQSPGSLPLVTGVPAETREGGRGLFLLEALATEWGTRHFGFGKSVWFVLADAAWRPGQSATPGDRPRELPEAEHSARRHIEWLTRLPPDLEQLLSSRQLLGELLHRLVAGLGLRQGWLFEQSDDDERRWEISAAHNVSGWAPDGETVRRLAQVVPAPALPDRNGVVFGLHGQSGLFGALALESEADLSGDDTALARLVADRMGVIIREDRAHNNLTRSRGSLALLAEASEMFAGTLDTQLTMTLAAQLVVPQFASWAVLSTAYAQEAPLVAVAHADESRLGPLRAAMSGDEWHQTVERIVAGLDGHRPLLVPADRLPQALRAERDGDVLVVPLVARRRLIGLLLAGRPAGSAYTAHDVALLGDLGRRAAVAIDSARLYEERTSIARALQASLLPPTLPIAEAVEFGARYVAAGEGNDVGGDFYDVFRLADGGWGAAIGDVCGKGPEAAAITGMARDVLRLLTRDGASPAEALRRLNGAMVELGERGRFCTATLATVHLRGSEVVVCLASAGHPPPVLLRANGDARLVGTSGTVLGVVDDIDVPADQVTLEPGDALVFYTDGVTERRNGNDMFGDDNLLASLRRAVGHSADALAGILERDVRSFSAAPSRDDLAVLVVRSKADAGLVASADPPGAVAVNAGASALSDV